MALRVVSSALDFSSKAISGRKRPFKAVGLSYLGLLGLIAGLDIL
jgi:hypothetical protein